VPASARNRFLTAALLTLFAGTKLCPAADGGAAIRAEASPASIVIGFVGGFVRHDNPRHGPVKLAKNIEREVPGDIYVRVFENRHRKTAYATIVRLLDRNHDGILTGDEKLRARIVLFGHSWGASAVVLLARELSRTGIPVMLTVQVDSVAKFWQKDGVIPANVRAAVNFYQPNGLIHGRSEISAADPEKTEILGNYRFDYRKKPVQCAEGRASWFDRLTPSHAQSECDPSLWAQVEDLVLQRVPAIAVSNSASH
jgi:pimeloyl-ACP methyl ester carboxylesterase